MGYIGNEPTTGHFPVQTNLVGPGPTYTLTQAPANAGAIEVSVAGVLQPTTAYSVSGTTLTMAGVATGIPIFIRHLGETLSIPVPGDGTVTDAKIIGMAASKLTGTIAGARLPDPLPAISGASLTGIIPADASVDGTKIAMGSDATGDVLYYNGTNYVRLAKASDGDLLTLASGLPAWVATSTSGIGLLDGTNTWTKGQRGEITPLVDAANIATDFNDSNHFSVTLTANRILDNPTNLSPGQSGSIFITQDATGGQTLSYGTYWMWAGGGAPSLSTGALLVDRLDYIVMSTSSIHGVLSLEIKV